MSGCSDNKSSPTNGVAAEMKSRLQSEMSASSNNSEDSDEQNAQTTEVISNTISFEPETTEESTTLSPTSTNSPTSEILETSTNLQTETISESLENPENKEQLYVITPSGKKYHYPDCRTVKTIKEYLTKEEAEAQGYEPCKICKPE